jgi:hypothetical protein
MIRSFAVAACVSLLMSTTALAQQGGGTPEEQRACAGNAQRYCRAVLGQGDFAVLACLQQNRARLSKACAKVLTDHGQ